MPKTRTFSTYRVARPNHADPRWREGYFVRADSPRAAVVGALHDAGSSDRVDTFSGADYFIASGRDGSPRPNFTVDRLAEPVSA